MRTLSFLAGQNGPLYADFRRPAAAPRASVLIIPPFAEELNKCRRMLALTAEALREAGVASLLLDLYGTGDSGGDFGDARWEIWLADLDVGAAYLAAQGCPVDSVLAVRSGALLAGAWIAGAAPALKRLVLWQAVSSGENYLSQFLRLRAMAAKLAGREEPVKQLKAQLSEGQTLEIAGYALAPALADRLEKARLADCPPQGIYTHLFEIGEEFSPAGDKLAAAWRAAGVGVQTAPLPGESFWATQEIGLAPALIDASVAAMVEEL